MISTVTTRVLKAQLSAWIHRAEAGEQILVLRGGRPVAALVPTSSVTEDSPEMALSRLAEEGRAILPTAKARPARVPPLPGGNGPSASQMVLDDRG